MREPSTKYYYLLPVSKLFERIGSNPPNVHVNVAL
jgi:hypothetical protein